MKAKEGRK